MCLECVGSCFSGTNHLFTKNYIPFKKVPNWYFRNTDYSRHFFNQTCHWNHSRSRRIGPNIKILRSNLTDLTSAVKLEIGTYRHRLDYSCQYWLCCVKLLHLLIHSHILYGLGKAKLAMQENKPDLTSCYIMIECVLQVWEYKAKSHLSH